MLRNSELNYGLIARTLHWFTALLFLCSYVSVYYRHWFTEYETPANFTARDLHLSVGITIGVLVLLRVIWTLSNKHPRPAPGSRLAQRAASWGHAALYVILIGMPLTGYMGTGINTNWFFLFEVPRFADTQLFKTVVDGWMGLTFDEIEPYLDFTHMKGGATIVWMLIVGHICAALYHHYVLRDRTLIKMTTG
ncbi:MAG: cytochrome b [Steroidobacteraceae bacterium]